MKSRLQFKSACFLNKYDILINPEMKWLLCVLQGVSHKFIIAVLMEYIRSLNQFQITVQVKLNRVTPCVSHWNIFSSSCVFWLIDCFFSALPVWAGDQDVGAAQPLLHAAPVPPVSRPQRLQTTGEFTPKLNWNWSSTSLELIFKPVLCLFVPNEVLK